MPTRNSPGTIPGDSDETRAGRIPMPADDVIRCAVRKTQELRRKISSRVPVRAWRG